MVVDHINKTQYTWWLDKLNKALSRPDNAELITIYAWGGTGKTEFTHFVARANADAWVKVCYVSLEMPSRQLALRYAIKKAWIKAYIDYQDKKYTHHQGELIEKYYKEFIEYNNISLCGEDRQYTLQDLLSNNNDMVGTMQYHYDMWYRMFVVDNLGKIITNKNELEAQEYITSSLQDWKNKMNCCVMLIHHTSKNKKWESWGMRWSQKIFDNSTKVIKLERTMDDTECWQEELAKLTIKQEKNSMRGDYVETECYFDRGVYIEEYVGNAYKNKTILDDIHTDLDDIF